MLDLTAQSGPSLSCDLEAYRVVVDADVHWTFPLDFVEVVWGDGDRTGREIVRATDQPPYASRRFRVLVPSAGGKKWVRFAAWDTAGNGAFAQPVKLR